MNNKLYLLGLILFAAPIVFAIVFRACGGEFFTEEYSEETKIVEDDYEETSMFVVSVGPPLWFLPLGICCLIGLILIAKHKPINVKSYDENLENKEKDKGDTNKESEK